MCMYQPTSRAMRSAVAYAAASKALRSLGKFRRAA